MGFSIGKALGAAVDTVTSPFKNEDDKPARKERVSSASTSSPRSSTSPDSSPGSGEPLSSSGDNPFAKKKDDGLLGNAGDFLHGLFGGDDDEKKDKPKKPDGPTVAVIDDFNPAAEGLRHGEAVEDVITQDGKVKKGDVQRIQQDSNIEPQAQDLDGMIEEYGTSLLDRTNTSLKKIADDKDSSVRTVNVSQATSQADLINGLLNNMTPDEVAVQLGLPIGTDPHILAQGLADRVNTVYGSSDRIKAAQASYNETTHTLSERGVTTVVAAGNSGENVQFLKDNYITVDDATIGDNTLVNNDVVVVGAADGEGGIAPFSASNSDVDVTADGTDIETGQGTQNGTSFAAPQVAAAIADIKKANPNLSNAEVMALLQQSSTDTGASNDAEGSGFLDSTQAVGLAQSQYDEDEAARVKKAKKDSAAENAGEFVHDVVGGIFGLVA